MKNVKDKYYMFVDESGESNLNHSGKYFILSTVIINFKDFQIIEGYLRLLKRKFLGSDFINIHTTDLCERPYQTYRKLVFPHNRINSFFVELCSILRNVPYMTGIYFVDKDKLRLALNYTPGKKKNLPGVNLDLAYEKCSLEAFKDFSNLLVKNNSLGEIVVESRFMNDGNFVSYFDRARQPNLPGNISNPSYKNIHDRIVSLTISNKKVVDGGLELADICSYTSYRKLYGDPAKTLKVSISQIQLINSHVRNNSYLKSIKGTRIGLKEVI